MQIIQLLQCIDYLQDADNTPMDQILSKLYVLAMEDTLDFVTYQVIYLIYFGGHIFFFQFVTMPPFLFFFFFF